MQDKHRQFYGCYPYVLKPASAPAGSRHNALYTAAYGYDPYMQAYGKDFESQSQVLATNRLSAVMSQQSEGCDSADGATFTFGGATNDHWRTLP